MLVEKYRICVIRKKRIKLKSKLFQNFKKRLRVWGKIWKKWDEK